MISESPIESNQNSPPPFAGQIRSSNSSFVQQLQIKLTHLDAEEAATIAVSSESVWQTYADARLRQFEKRG
jgi:hypothetical protein